MVIRTNWTICTAVRVLCTAVLARLLHTVVLDTLIPSELRLLHFDRKCVALQNQAPLLPTLRLQDPMELVLLPRPRDPTAGPLHPAIPVIIPLQLQIPLQLPPQQSQQWHRPRRTLIQWHPLRQTHTLRRHPRLLLLQRLRHPQLQQQ